MGAGDFGRGYPRLACCGYSAQYVQVTGRPNSNNAATGSKSSLVNATNCVFERVWSYFTAPSGIPVFRNNTFFGGEFDFYPAVTNGIVKDNIFDHTVFGFDLTGYGYDGGFNAFVTSTNYLYPTNAADIILASSPAYQTGPLGRFYQLISSGLFNADTNTTAAQVGLFHYTTITNLAGGYEIKETNSVLDVGFH